MDDIYPSAFVESIAGRDKGKIFVVLSEEDENYVAISDGRVRKSDRPKRKKKKHLNALGRNSDFIAQKLRDGTKVTNSELRTAIAELTTSSQISGGRYSFGER